MSPVRAVTYDFTGWVVLITGGGSGIGHGITRAFLDAGATVAITGRCVKRLEQTVTELTEGLGDDERVLAAFTNRIALGRPAQPEDIAPAVLFLASEGARYITGAVLSVDGGTSASTGQPHL